MAESSSNASLGMESSTRSLTPIGNPLPVTSALLCYFNDIDSISKEQLMPSVAYMVKDEIKDTMYDTFLFLPNSGDRIGAKSKNEWECYITNHLFAKGYNMDALEQAVEETKQALGKNFKVNVIMSVLNPITNKSFGDVDGQNLDFTRLDDRKTAVKWMVDEEVKQFKARNYSNLNLAGFYWYAEGIEPECTEISVVRYFTDYVRSLGYFSCWIPFHGAPGCDIGMTTCGFDKVNMQGNFFPDNPAYPNNYAYSEYYGHQTAQQTFERAAKIIDPNGLGYEMELAGDTQIAYTGFKIYLLYGVRLGFMRNHEYQAYYMGGPSTLRDMYRSTDPYVQSTYGQLYKFIKRTLTEDEITLRPKNADVILAKDW